MVVVVSVRRLEDPAYQNVNNALLDALSKYHFGDLVVSCLTDGEVAQVSLSCHFALACVSIGTCLLRLTVTFERWDDDNGVCASSTALGIGRRERHSEQCFHISCHNLDVFQFCRCVACPIMTGWIPILGWKWRPFRCGASFFA